MVIGGAQTSVIIEVATRRVTRVRLPDSDVIAAISYDGTRLWRVDESGIDVLNRKGQVSHHIPLTSMSDEYVFQDVSWSRTGRKVAYTDGSGLYVVAADDGGSRRRIASGNAIGDPAWFPNGESIAYTDYSQSPSRVIVAGLDGSRRTLVSGSRPAISPDGRMVAFEASEAVYSVPSSGGVPGLVSGGARSPLWSPDGHFVAFTRDEVCDGAVCGGRVFIAAMEDDVVFPVGPKSFEMSRAYWVSTPSLLRP